MPDGRVINLNFRHALPAPLLYVGFVDYYGPLDMRSHSAHRHGHYQFFAVTEGRFLFVPESGREIWLHKGDVIVFRPGVLHNWHVEPDTICRTFMVFFDAIPDGVWLELGQRFAQDADVGHRTFTVSLLGAAPMLAALRSECEQSKPMANAVVYGLTMAFMAFAARQLAPGAAAEPVGGFAAPLAAALEFIEAKHATALTVRDMADQAGVSPTRLNELLFPPGSKFLSVVPTPFPVACGSAWPPFRLRTPRPAAPSAAPPVFPPGSKFLSVERKE